MNLNSLFARSIETRLKLINYQTVRWRRSKKPFWLGVAKSKQFIIPQPRKIFTPEEREKLSQLNLHYDTMVKSLLNFIAHENPLLAKDDIKEENEAVKMLRSMKNNESFNEESARRRNERLKKEEEENAKRIMETIELNEEQKRKHLEFIEEIVRKEKALSDSYITPENLEEAIEKCLKNVQCFDFAIDHDGKRYHGRESLQAKPKDFSEQVAESHVA